MGFWFDLGGPDGGQRAFLNFGDWAGREEIDAWKDVALKWCDNDKITIADEAGGPGPGDWVKIALHASPGAVNRNQKR